MRRLVSIAVSASGWKSPALLVKRFYIGIEDLLSIGTFSLVPWFIAGYKLIY